MDPVSIIESTARLAETCVKIYTYVKSIQAVDVNIRVLTVELDQLSMVLDSITDGFKVCKGPNPLDWELGSLTGHEARYWENVKKSLDDCKQTLATLDGILKKIKPKEHGLKFFKQATSRIQLDIIKSEEIALLKQQIAAYRRAMQLSLQLITISSVLNNEQANAGLSSRLDLLTVDIQQLSLFVRSRSNSTSNGSHDEHNSRIMNNLEECARSAAKLVSAASTIIGSSAYGSVYGEPIGAEQVEAINRWNQETREAVMDEEDPDGDVSSLAESDCPINDAGENDNYERVLPSVSQTSREEPKDEKVIVESTLPPVQSKPLDSEAYVGKFHSDESTIVRQTVAETAKELNRISKEYSDEPQNGDLDEITTLKERRNKNPDDLALHNPLAESIRMSQDAIEKAPRNYWLWHNLCRLYASINSLDEAIQACELGMKRASDNPSPLMELTNLYAAKGDYKAAVTIGMLLLKVKPNVILSVLQDSGPHEDKLKSKLERLQPGIQQNSASVKEWLSANTAFTVTPRGAQMNLHFAAWTGDSEILAKLTPQEKEDIIMPDNYGWTTLHLAVWNMHTNVVRFFLKNTTPSQMQWISAQNNDGLTALHLASCNNDHEMIKILVNAEILFNMSGSISLQDNDGQTPMHLAAKNGHVDTIRLLKDLGGHVSVQNKDGATPMHLAAMIGCVDAIKVLTEAGADVSARSRLGATPMHWAAMNGRVDTIGALKKAKADVSARSKLGATPMHWAAERGQADAIKALREGGADVSARDKNGDTPMHWAARNGHVSAIKALTEAGGNVLAQDKAGETPMHKAALHGQVDAIKALTEAGGNVFVQDKSGDTPMHKAALHGHIDAIKALKEAGGNVLARDKAGETPMHKAALHGQVDAIKALTEAGGNVFVQDKSGDTPMHKAALHGHVDAIKALKEAGVNVLVRNKDGMTPMNSAIWKSQWNTVAVLKKLYSIN